MQPLRPLTISFEFFPPKTSEGLTALCETAQCLQESNPQFFSVTFGAGGSTRRGTLETVQLLQAHTGVSIAPHLSCIGLQREEIVRILDDYQRCVVKRIVVLRGDMPSGMVQMGDVKFASELVRLIRDISGDYFHIEVAAYPEFHPQAISVQDDILNLKRKYEAGADSAITQYFFNADAYFYYREDCERLAMPLPIIPGIMPITQFTKLARFSAACGAEIPRWIRKRLESYGDDLHAIREFGMEVVYNLCQRLIAGGVSGLHFYTLNQAEAALEIVRLLGFIPAQHREVSSV
ncbi:MAG: methylenetetrahydrofolate reductase [NAD(P)H] [Gammaproteobacteria bacterium RIFCSPHIGHO2_12_FULL_41_20]|nr:MAG: methylenetetrahydrofolate reductase [NAD(P)H] [Gammaproteobacteria bacterium RIFCSPHIGHO2_12_FULL_41_20]